MKKKIITALILAGLILANCTSCGNQDMWDTNFTYDYAIVAFPNGETKTIEIKKWCDYDGEQIQIIAKDGTVYLVNSVNCVLVNEK
jgi:hypothetical protein